MFHLHLINYNTNKKHFLVNKTLNFFYCYLQFKKKYSGSSCKNVDFLNLSVRVQVSKTAVNTLYKPTIFTVTRFFFLIDIVWI